MRWVRDIRESYVRRETPPPELTLPLSEFDLSTWGEVRRANRFLCSCRRVVGPMLRVVEQFLNGLQFGCCVLLAAVTLSSDHGLVNLAQARLYMMAPTLRRPIVAWGEFIIA